MIELAKPIPFYGQYGEDRIIRERVRLPERGVFVDVGAGDGVTGSNSYHFEQIGWYCLCIDADKRQFLKLSKTRKKSDRAWKAVGQTEGSRLFTQAVDPTISTLGEHVAGDLVEVPGQPLEALLREYDIGKIDVLSIDVEGSELEVWQSMNWDKHRPTAVIIEWKTVGLPPADEEIISAFRGTPYVLVAQTPGNLIFCLNDHLLPQEANPKKPFSTATIRLVNRLYQEGAHALHNHARECVHRRGGDDPETLLARGMAFWRAQDTESAIACIEQLTHRVPEWAFGHYMLALFLGETQQFAAALPHAIKAWDMEPGDECYGGYVEKMYYALGRWPERVAAIDYLYRLRGQRILSLDGIDLTGKHVVIMPGANQGGHEDVMVPAEHNGSIAGFLLHHRHGPHHDAGLGESLQYVRYVERLKQREALVTFVVQSSLVSLFRRSFGSVRVVAPNTPVPTWDYSMLCWKAPIAFSDTPATIPVRMPYLIADPVRRKLWPVTWDRRKFSIGLCYGGDPRIKKDAERSIPLALFKPLAELPNVELISLQIPPRNAEVEQVDFPVLDLGKRFVLADGFEDIAAVMAELDLIVAVDSAPVHLAGALGKPTFLLLAMLHQDYRWGLDAEKTPWYPSMRLFKQKRPGDWEEVMSRVVEAVKEMRP